MQKIMSKSVRFLLIALLGLFASEAGAQAPGLINFQAQVDNLGSGTATVVYSIFDTPTGGTSQWSEVQNINVQGGIMQVLLGSETPFPESLFSTDGDRYLEMVINGETLAPRFRLTSVAYSLRSNTADALADGAVNTLNDLQGNVNLVAGDNVSINTSGQNVTINAEGAGGVSTVNEETGDIVIKEGANITITKAGPEITISAATVDTSTSTGIFTVSPGSGIAVTGENGPLATVSVAQNGIDDFHVKDNALTANSLASNAVGEEELADGTAVRSVNGITDDLTLQGSNSVSITRSGQMLTFEASGGIGVGIASINGGNGIDVTNPNGPTATVSVAPTLTLGPSGGLGIQNGSSQTVSLLGGGPAGGALFLRQANGNFDAVDINIRTGGGGTPLGGQFRLRGNPDWDAIHMFSDSDTQGARVVLREPNPGNPADAYTTMVLRGEDSAGHIIVLRDNDQYINIGGSDGEMRSRGKVALGLTEGEFDSDNPLGPALFVRGDIQATGNVSTGVSISSIDHPLDPTNRVLNHADVTSPEMLTVYSGNVVLDASGEASVDLPEWFESLNRDFRYQLTCIGGFANVYIAEKITNNRFRVAGGAPGLEVSWQVTAVRNDPLARMNPVQVEEDKDVNLRGAYLHPAAYGVNDQ